MKLNQFFGPYGAALAVLFLFSDVHCVLSKKSVEDVLSSEIETEAKQLAEESKKNTEEFMQAVSDVKEKTKQDVNDVALLDCDTSNVSCLSSRGKKILKIEVDFKKAIAKLKKDREKLLIKQKKEVDRKMKEANDLLGAASSVSVQDSLAEQEDSLGNVLSEADKYLMLLLSSEPTEAYCDIEGLNDENILESEWETLMIIFEAIVNLGYVDSGKDRIFLDDEDKASPARRNLRRRRFLSSNTGTCSSCSGGDITADIAGGNGDEGAKGHVSRFNKFVNDYLAAFIMAEHTAQLENGKGLKVECTFE